MGQIIGAIVAVSFVIALLYGYIVNIIWLLQQTPFVANIEAVLSIIGIFIAPLGVIMGWLH